MKRQKAIGYQMDMFIEHKQSTMRHSENRKDVNGAKAGRVKQVSGERQQGRALTDDLMTKVCSSSNLKRAYRQVKRNKGVAGIDQMPVDKFAEWFIQSGEMLLDSLLQGTYQPQAVKP